MIRIIAVGKIKDSHLVSLIEDYKKKINRYHKIEIVEVKDHPWFVGVQFHPEFKSRPNKPQKLFADFIRASKEYSEKNN